MGAGGGGVKNVEKITPSFLGLEIMNLLAFFFSILSRKSVSGSRLHGVYMGRSGTSAVYALFGHFSYVGGFGDLGDPMVPTLRVVSGGVVTIHTY